MTRFHRSVALGDSTTEGLEDPRIVNSGAPPLCADPLIR